MATRNSIQWREAGLVGLALAALSLSGYYAAQRLLPSWFSASGASSPLDGGPIPTFGAATGPQYDISRITRAHLFGTATEATQRKVAEAPETKLQLDLMGLIASADQQFARAIIRVNGSRVRPYSIGDTISGTDAAIHSVESGRVLLDRSGALESLALKRQSILDSSNTTSSNPAGASSALEQVAPSAPATADDPQITEFRDKAANDRMKQPF